MATEESLYPSLKEEEEVIDRGDLDKLIATQITGALSQERCQMMYHKKEAIDAILCRHLKNKRRYNLLGTIAKISGLVITSSLTIVTIIFTSGVAVPLFVLPICGGLTLFSVGLSESLQKLLKNKKGHNGKKIDILRDTLSKMEIYLEKAKDDKTITLGEVEEFSSIYTANSAKMSEVNKKKQSAHKDLESTIIQLLKENPNLLRR